MWNKGQENPKYDPELFYSSWESKSPNQENRIVNFWPCRKNYFWKIIIPFKSPYVQEYNSYPLQLL